MGEVLEFSAGWAADTADWRALTVDHWLRVFAGKYEALPCRVLEVGTYEGRSAIWAVKHLCKHADSAVVCVDGWWRLDLYERFLRNIVTAGVAGKIKIMQGWSQQVLRKLEVEFDVVYVDGGHEADATLTTAVLGWLRLKVGGEMVFDDFGGTDHPGVKAAVEAFKVCFAGKWELLHQGYQVILRKVK